MLTKSYGHREGSGPAQAHATRMPVFRGWGRDDCTGRPALGVDLGGDMMIILEHQAFGGRLGYLEFTVTQKREK